MLTNALLGTSRSTAVLEEWCMPRIARWPPRPKHPYQRISIASNRRNPAWQAHPTTDSQVMQLSTHQPGAASTAPDKHPFHRGSPPRAWGRYTNSPAFAGDLRFTHTRVGKMPRPQASTPPSATPPLPRDAQGVQSGLANLSRLFRR